MDNNTNIEQNTQSENMGNDANVQGAAAKDNAGSEKTFTQEEVNGFVQSRVERLRRQIEKDSKAEYEQKMAELNARENKLLVKEKLNERNMPRELADIITCTDENDLNAKLDALQKIYGGNAKETPKQETGFRQIGVPNEGNQSVGVDPVRQAMGLI